VRIYLAARFDRYPEMRDVRRVLHAWGHEVTARWIDLHGGGQTVAETTPTLDADPYRTRRLAQEDVEDIEAADLVIVFTSPVPTTTGGHHVELGLALGLGKRLAVCGPRTNVFHTLPQVVHFATWGELEQAFVLEFDTRPDVEQAAERADPPVVVCPHCVDGFTAADLADGDVLVVCTMCARAGRPPAAPPSD
jgi:nucleoside 2-deoxyribosyltransferase